LNTSKSGIWDYEVRQGKVEQKFLNDSGERPSKSVVLSESLNNLGPEIIEDIKNTLSKYDVKGMNLFLVNDDSLKLY